MSADLQWLLTKNWSAFQVKRRQSGTKTLTSEPLNLTNVHSQKYSGLVSDKAVGLAVAKDNKGAVLSVKSNKPRRFNPYKSVSKVTLKKDFRRVARTVRTHVNKYRPDLTKTALARWNLIARAQRRAAPKTAAAKKQ